MPGSALRRFMSETTGNAETIRLSDVFVARGPERPVGNGIGTSAAQSGAPSEAVRNFRVGLVTMPFSPCWTGSAQIGLLKSIVKRSGFEVEDFYPNVELAALLGVDFYQCVSQQYTMYQMTGEWLFSVAAFGDQAGTADYFEMFPG